MASDDDQRLKELEELFPTVRHSPELKPEKVDWVVEDLWQAGKINFIAGPEKSGKTRWQCQMLVSLFTGADTQMGFKLGDSLPEKLLYLCGEETPGQVADRIRRYAVHLGVNADHLPIDYLNASMMQLERYDVRLKLEELLKRKGYDSLLIDPLRRVHMADENDNNAMAALNNTFRKWSNELGITQLLTHHTGSTALGWDPGRIANWLRGATDIATVLDTATLLYRPDVSRPEVMLYRAGRYAPAGELNLVDGGDPPDGNGWRLANERKSH